METRSGLKIRQASALDVDAAARLRTDARIAALDGVVDDAVLERLDAATPDVATAFATDMAQRGASYFVAQDADGVLIALAKADAAQADDFPILLELTEFVVSEPARVGKLASTLLMRAVGDELDSVVYVLEGDAWVRSFLAAEGYEPDGSALDPESGAQAVRMVRHLS